MKREQIKQIEPFCEIFPVENNILRAVSDDMRINGYDENFPVIVWKTKGKTICIDGNTRLMAAEIVGIDEIPVLAKSFEDEDEAIRYAIHCQRDRRNMTDADITAKCPSIRATRRPRRKERGWRRRK